MSVFTATMMVVSVIAAILGVVWALVLVALFKGKV